MVTHPIIIDELVGRVECEWGGMGRGGIGCEKLTMQPSVLLSRPSCPDPGFRPRPGGTRLRPRQRPRSRGMRPWLRPRPGGPRQSHQGRIIEVRVQEQNQTLTYTILPRRLGLGPPGQWPRLTLVCWRQWPRLWDLLFNDITQDITQSLTEVVTLTSPLVLSLWGG